LAAKIRIVWLSASVVVALLAWSGWKLLFSDPLASLEFPLIDGRRLSMSALQDRPVLVVFWSIDCRPCIEEIPMLSRIYSEFRPRGLEIIAVAMPYDAPARVLESSRRYSVPYPVALDIDSRAVHAFGDVSYLPASFLFGADGRLLLNRTGSMEEQELRNAVLAAFAGSGH
jgi:thiol-disulfide isomerase/thioredoxin